MEGDDEKDELRGGRRGDGAADGVLEFCRIRIGPRCHPIYFFFQGDYFHEFCCWLAQNHLGTLNTFNKTRKTRKAKKKMLAGVFCRF